MWSKTLGASKNLPKITFLNEQVTVDAAVGETLLDVAQRHGINLFRGLWQGIRCCARHPTGWCGRCKVYAKPLTPDALSPRTWAERLPLRVNGALPRVGTLRLACQTRIHGDVEVRTRSGFEIPPSLDWPPDPRPFKWRERWEKRGEAGNEEKPKPPVRAQR